MTRMVLTILVLFSLLMVAANYDDTLEQRVRRLELLVEHMNDRVDQLSDEVKRLKQSTTEATTSRGAIGVVFLIESIRRLPIDDSLKAEGELLVEEAVAREEEADEKDADRAGVRAGRNRVERNASRARKEQYRTEANNLRTQARTLRMRGYRMIRKAEMPHYEVNGWDGSRFLVVYISRFDATSVLRRLSEGDFAKYTGDIISDSRNEVAIDARSIKPAQRPANFKDP